MILFQKSDCVIEDLYKLYLIKIQIPNAKTVIWCTKILLNYRIFYSTFMPFSTLETNIF